MRKLTYVEVAPMFDNGTKTVIVTNIIMISKDYISQMFPFDVLHSFNGRNIKDLVLIFIDNSNYFFMLDKSRYDKSVKINSQLVLQINTDNKFYYFIVGSTFLKFLYQIEDIELATLLLINLNEDI